MACFCADVQLRTYSLSLFLSLSLLLDNYISCKKYRTSSRVKITGQDQGHFWRVQGHSAILLWLLRFRLQWLLLLSKFVHDSLLQTNRTYAIIVNTCYSAGGKHSLFMVLPHQLMFDAVFFHNHLATVT